jgi:hypothetical protein
MCIRDRHASCATPVSTVPIRATYSSRIKER